MPHSVEIAAAAIFCLALLHTFTTARIGGFAIKYPRHAGLFHFLAEVEVVFGFWALILCLVIWLLAGSHVAIDYLEQRKFTEPLFVFVIMVIAASRPVLALVTQAVTKLADVFPGRAEIYAIWLSLSLIPLLGSFITEPAAMTLAALLLRDRLFRENISTSVKYFGLAVLFVNISIGGVLTSFAAPPVLMVATAWGWGTSHMALTFGWRAAIAVLVNATIFVLFVARRVPTGDVAGGDERQRIPLTVTLIHIMFLVLVVLNAHHAVVFIGAFLFFLGYTHAYEKYQSPLLLRESLLVAFFLGGLVVLGGLQQWWLQPVVSSMSDYMLFAGATGLTAVMDNAAITYLGSLIAGLSEQSKYFLVAGAVAGGGLTVIANAPNPAGLALVGHRFPGGVSALNLLGAAVAPTAAACLALLAL
ncbi:putative Na+/H+ antiporter [Paraburkholderia terrae]|uniref:putative Na+/H+ antiporter n=1 Tax=Paraburkholderia terrae TaxID=311230 RepID=UPI00336563B3